MKFFYFSKSDFSFFQEKKAKNFILLFTVTRSKENSKNTDINGQNAEYSFFLFKFYRGAVKFEKKKKKKIENFLSISILYIFLKFNKNIKNYIKVKKNLHYGKKVLVKNFFKNKSFI
jgi:hypothetical protein